MPRQRRNKRVSLLLLLAASVTTASVSHADTVTYDLGLASTDGGSNGSGTLVLEGAPPAAGFALYLPFNGTLENLTFDLNGVSFVPMFPNAEFEDGQLVGLGSTSFESDEELSTGAATEFNLFVSGQELDSGDITAVLAPTAITPEPSGVELLGTGLLGIAAVRKRRPVQSVR